MSEPLVNYFNTNGFLLYFKEIDIPKYVIIRV